MSARDRLRHLSVDWLRPLIVVVILLAVGAQWWEAERDRDYFAGQVAAGQATQAEFAEALADANGRIEALGGQPSVEVEQTPDGPEPVDAGEASQQGEQGEPGETGPPPSAAQVAEAVDRYCATNGCTGPQGPSPSPLEVAQAVASYCDARGDCAGPTGVAGGEGPAGEAGPAGPAPSDAQIAAAVEDYCAAHDGCAGLQGEPGETGATGATGSQGPQGPTGPAGPACPEGAQPVTWTVDAARSTVIGLDPGTYVVCRAT